MRDPRPGQIPSAGDVARDAEMLAQAETGTTGIEGVQKRELVETG